MKTKLQSAAAWLGILALGLLVYAPGLPGGFLYDDLGSIVDNPNLQFHELTPENLYWAALSSPTGGLLRPLSMLSFALNAYFTGMTPFGFKLTNIFIHLACGVLLWFTTRELLRAYAARCRLVLDVGTRNWLCFAVMAVWLLHPINLTPVLYIVQRETQLSTLFMIGAILCYLVGRRRESEGRPAVPWIWIGTPTLAGLGLLCKETALLTPLYILAAELTLLGFSKRESAPSRNARLFQWVFLLLPALAVMAALALKPGGLHGMYEGRGFTLGQRLLTECRVLVDYLRWILLPDVSQFALYHDDLLPSQGWFSPPSTLLSALLLLVLLGGAIGLRRRQPLVSFALLWFFAGQVLESTFLPLELAFEHRNYLPDFGLFAGLLPALYLWARQHGRPRLGQAAIVAAAGLCAAVTALRASEWHSEMSFAQYEVIHQPRSARALEQLAWSYVIYMRVTGDMSVLPAAVAAEERAHAIEPASLAPNLGIANIYAVAHDLPKARLYLQATAEDARTADPTPTNQHALQTLGHWRTDEDPDLEHDVNAIFANVLANPKMRSDPCYLANIYNTYAVLDQGDDKVLRAASMMHHAISLCPGNMAMLVNYAYLLLSYHDPKDAEPVMAEIRKSHDLRYLAQRQVLEAMLQNERARQDKRPPSP